MTSEKTEDGKSTFATSIALICSAIAIAVLALILFQGRSAQEDANDVIRAAGQHVSAVPPETVSERGDELVTWALNTVHKAVETENAASREAKLTIIAKDAALADLQQGVLDASGLENSEEEFHEVELLENNVTTGGQVLAASVRWRAVGLIAGAKHRHRLGNTYSADISLAWSGSEWRMTDLNIADLDTSDAGEIVDAER